MVNCINRINVFDVSEVLFAFKHLKITVSTLSKITYFIDTPHSVLLQNYLLDYFVDVLYYQLGLESLRLINIIVNHFIYIPTSNNTVEDSLSILF